MSVAGFVLGLVALLADWAGCVPGMWWLGLIVVAVGILAIVMSSVAMARAGKIGGKKGLAVAGLVLGIVGTLGAALAVVCGILFVSVLEGTIDLVNVLP